MGLRCKPKKIKKYIHHTLDHNVTYLCVEQRCHRKSILDAWVVLSGLPLHYVPELAELGDELVHLVSLNKVIKPCYHQHIYAPSLLLVLESEGLLKVFHLAAWNGHIVDMNNVTLVGDLLTRFLRVGGGEGEEHMKG